MDTLIEASHASLRFSAPSEKKGSLKKWTLDALRGRPGGRKSFLAVDDVSFRIDRGEAVGLVGRNGAGKSTLLKLVSGIVEPTSGTVAVRGQVAPLLALGNGLDPALTGRENIYLNGAILGYSKAWLRSREESIAEFSELGGFLDAQVRTYSSGMTMRLAFAIATAASPEILILDEVLAVGDSAFQAKCRARISEIIADGATVFFVSHSLPNVVELCSRAIWLEKGRVRMDGPAAAVADAYRADSSASIRAASAGGAAGVPVPVHAFRSEKYGGAQFVTASAKEAADLRENSASWEYDGVAWRAHSSPMPGTVPLHRFYCKAARRHAYAADEGGIAALRAGGGEWAYEGVSQHVFPSKAEGTVPVTLFERRSDGLRQLLPPGRMADSFRMAGSGWTDSGVAFWAYPA